MLVDKMELHIGGCAADTAIGLARIGISSSVIGKVGKDGFGDFVVKYMQQQGVEVSGVVRDEREFTSADDGAGACRRRTLFYSLPGRKCGFA
jgi:sugar/nucleoside kinase (ribokinase family)